MAAYTALSSRPKASVRVELYYSNFPKENVEAPIRPSTYQGEMEPGFSFRVEGRYTNKQEISQLYEIILSSLQQQFRLPPAYCCEKFYSGNTMFSLQFSIAAPQTKKMTQAAQKRIETVLRNKLFDVENSEKSEERCIIN